MSETDLIRLEHATLRPLGEYLDHCEQCRLAHGCGHEELINVYTWGSRVPVQRICERCGIKVDA